MKILLIVLGAIVVLIATVVAIGAYLPKRHVVSRSAVFKANPERLFGLVAGSQSWRPEVKTCEVIQENGKTFQRETSRHGQTVTYAIEGRSEEHTSELQSLR